MDTGILFEFTELAKNLNFTETARLLNMSQPTLSKHINALEKDLRLSLFERSGSSMRLTVAGTALLSYAYKIIEAETAFEEKAKELRTTPSAHLTIGGLVDEGIVTHALSLMLAQLGNDYGTGFLEIKYCKHQLPKEILGEKAVDMIFDYASKDDITDDDDIDIVQLGRCSWIALVSAQNPLAQQACISIDDIRDQTLIKIEGSHMSAAWHYIEKACMARGFRPKIRRHYSMKITDLLTTTASICDDVLIMGENYVKRIETGIAPFCVQVPLCDDDAFFPLSAVYRTDRENPMLDEAIDILRQNAFKLDG